MNQNNLYCMGANCRNFATVFSNSPKNCLIIDLLRVINYQLSIVEDGGHEMSVFYDGGRKFRARGAGKSYQQVINTLINKVINISTKQALSLI